MSYSFSVKAATFAAAIALANTEYDAVVAREPAHAHDRESAFKNVDNAFANITVKDNHDISLFMNGSLSWDWNDGQSNGADRKTFTGSNIGCGIGQTARPVDMS